jgi:hypothetical protein
MAFYYGTNCPGLNVEALQNRRKNGSKEYSCKGVNSMVSILLEFIVHCFASSTCYNFLPDYFQSRFKSNRIKAA